MNKTLTNAFDALRLTEQDIREYLDKYVHEVATVNDVPFGVLVRQLTGHVYLGTDEHLYIVKGDA